MLLIRHHLLKICENLIIYTKNRTKQDKNKKSSKNEAAAGAAAAASAATTTTATTTTATVISVMTMGTPKNQRCQKQKVN